MSKKFQTRYGIAIHSTNPATIRNYSTLRTRHAAGGSMLEFEDGSEPAEGEEMASRKEARNKRGKNRRGRNAAGGSMREFDSGSEITDDQKMTIKNRRVKNASVEETALRKKLDKAMKPNASEDVIAELSDYFNDEGGDSRDSAFTDKALISKVKTFLKKIGYTNADSWDAAKATQYLKKQSGFQMHIKKQIGISEALQRATGAKESQLERELDNMKAKIYSESEKILAKAGVSDQYIPKAIRDAIMQSIDY
jgi:hypothetical protein